MKPRIFDSAASVGALLLAVMVLMAGCGTTPRAQWAEQRSALNTIQNTVSDAHDAGRISDQQYLEAAEVMLSVQEYLRQARNASTEDERQRLMDHVNAGLRALREYRRLAEPEMDQ